MKRGALALCAGIVLLGLVPGSTLAVVPSNLDQSNLGHGSSEGSAADFAQTFTTGRSGLLSGVDLWMNGSGTATADIEAVSAGVPDSTPLVSASAAEPSSGQWVHFSFPAPLTVTSGAKYAIVFNTTSLGAAWGSPDDYSGGQAYLDNAGSWVALTSPPYSVLDFAFRTYVGHGHDRSPSGTRQASRPARALR